MTHLYVFVYSVIAGRNIGVCENLFLKDLWSISSAFYAHVFLYESALRSFSLLHFGFVIFWQKDIGEKSSSKMLMKLTPWRYFSWANTWHGQDNVLQMRTTKEGWYFNHFLYCRDCTYVLTSLHWIQWDCDHICLIT